MRATSVGLGGLLVLVSVIGGCNSDPPLALSVDLRTDFVPVEEFIGVRTRVWGYDGAARTARVWSGDHTPSTSGAYREGVRIAEVRDVGIRRFDVEVSLVGRDGGELARRNIIVTLSRSYALTVVVTRDCRALNCPTAGDPAYATACVAGRCADPRCGGEGAMTCPPPECSFDADCPVPAATCARARCSEGACLAVPTTACSAGLWCNPDVGCEPSMGLPDAGALDAGGPDAGAPASLVIAARPVGTPTEGQLAVLAATDAGFLVAYGVTGGGGLALAHTDPSGNPVSQDTLIATGMQEPQSMAVGPSGRVALTWSDVNTPHVGFVETGALVDDRELSLTGGLDRALVAAGPDGFEVAWHESDGRIRAQNITAAGGVGPIVEVEVVTDAEVQAIASAASGYLVVYGNLDVRRVRLLSLADGTAVAPSRELLRPADPPFGSGWGAAAVGRGAGFLVILADVRPDVGVLAYSVSADVAPGPPISMWPSGRSANAWVTANAVSGEALALFWSAGAPQLQRFDPVGAPIGPPSTFTLPPLGRIEDIAWRQTGLGVLVQSGTFLAVGTFTDWP